MSDERSEGFVHDTVVDEPGIVGARWWNRALVDEAAAVTRREAMRTLAIGVGVVGVVAAAGVAIVASSGPDYQHRSVASLDAQRRYGWNVGARDRVLRYTTPPTPSTLADALATLRTDLTPTVWRHVHDGTIFDAPDAYPPETPAEENVSFRALRDELGVSASATATAVFGAGSAVARLLGGAASGVALVVDTDGPDAIAFAAGAATVFEPVSAIANWPHPRGVVAVHEVLAAALQFQLAFRSARPQRAATAPPCFVLDRRRLIEAVSSEVFDNRYLAQLPSAATLRAGGITRVLYVVPFPFQLPELDDLNADLVALARAGIEVRAVALTAFRPGLDGAYYYGSQETDASFFADYAWGPSALLGPTTTVEAGPRDWRPAERATRFSRRATPGPFAQVDLIVANNTVLGAAFDPRGSWNRAASSYGGG